MQPPYQDLLGPAQSGLCSLHLQATFPLLYGSTTLAFALFHREAKFFTALAHTVPCD